MRAGELRHRATLQRPDSTVNAHGESDPTWTNFASRVPVQVFEQGSREVWNAQQRQPQITHVVSMRWLEGVTAAMRVLWHDGPTDRTLNIDGPPINPDGKRIAISLTCVEPT